MSDLHSLVMNLVALIAIGVGLAWADGPWMLVGYGLGIFIVDMLLEARHRATLPRMGSANQQDKE